MADRLVTVENLTNLRPHPNADSLDLAEINGWQVVVRKGAFVENELVVYLEDGVEVDESFADVLGITPYLRKRTNINGDKVLVVGRVRLRGEPSFGAVLPYSNFHPFLYDMEYDIIETPYTRKFEPPVKHTAGDVAPDLARFPRYTNIQNLRNFPEVFEEGELVVVTEKIHGTNGRWGYYTDDEGNMVLVAGSRKHRRKPPVEGEDFLPNGEVNPDHAASWSGSTYWLPMTDARILLLMGTEFAGGLKSLIFYGEIYGKGVQNFDYGQDGKTFAIFDIMANGEFLDFDGVVALAEDYDLPLVPIDGIIPFDMERIKAYADLPSTLTNANIREGVVVRPLKERTHPKVGRVIMKYVSDKFLFSKEGEKETTDA